MDIIRGSNNPLAFAVSEDFIGLKKLQAQLYQYGELKKEWSLADVKYYDDILLLPLTESDTLALTRGKAELDIKGLTADDRVIFADIINYWVVSRENNNKFLGGETNG